MTDISDDQLGKALDASSGRSSATRDNISEADPSRISKLIEELGEIGADPDGGVSRLAITPQEREAHDLVGKILNDLGLHVRTDTIGNTSARRQGGTIERPSLAVGSHLDSVPRGGRFDGVAGVVAMVELMRLLEADHAATLHPIVGLVFTAEEGARFGEPCIGSKVAVGALDNRALTRIRDADGISVADALSSLGFDANRVSEARWRPRDVASFFELHIEQGRVLETEEVPIGLVDMVSGSTRLWLKLNGRADHSGATPMRDRQDALTAAAEIALSVESLANDPVHRGTRATVGRLDTYPNSITTIPGYVRMSVDVRDLDGDRQRRTAAEIVDRAQAISRRRGIKLAAQVMADTSPTVLPMWLRRVLSDSASRLKVETRVMSAGASHDAQIIAGEIPAAMVFVPSRAGLSHSPDEWSSSVDIARGVDVLYRALLQLDELSYHAS